MKQTEAGSHSLERFINDGARDITDPERKGPHRTPVTPRPPDRSVKGRAPTSRRSSNTPGSESLNVGFGGEGGDGIYHSIHDNFEPFMRFSDTSFVSGRAPAQTATIRLAGAELPPVQFGNMAETYQGYIDELKGILATRRDETVERNRQLDERVFSATRDPRHPRKAPARADVAPHLNLAPLDNAITTLRLATERLEHRLRRDDDARGSGSPRAGRLEAAEHAARLIDQARAGLDQ